MAELWEMASVREGGGDGLTQMGREEHSAGQVAGAWGVKEHGRPTT
jgi:hypothetical protein